MTSTADTAPDSHSTPSSKASMPAGGLVGGIVQKRAMLGIAIAIIGWIAANAILPSGLPVGIALLGVVLGSLYALTALGLVLLYKASRIVNFSQAELGGLAASVAVVMVAGSHLPYFLAVPIGLAVAVGTGALIEATVIRRFFKAPRLILTIATLGIAQILGAAEIEVPTLFSHLAPYTTFTTPFSFHFTVGPVVFDGNDLLAVMVVPVVLVGIWLFLGRTDTGIAIRAAADSSSRATLLGIPVRRLSMITWMLAAGLSGLGAILAAPITGPQLGIVEGPQALLIPLAAAIVGRMEKFPTTFFAAIGITILQQAIFWSYPQSTTVDIVIFVIVVVALLLQRKNRNTELGDENIGSHQAFKEVKALPRDIASIYPIKQLRIAIPAAMIILAVILPFAFNPSKVTLLTYMAIYGIIAISLVVLAGWAGQISLGQFAFAGMGAAATGSILMSLHLDLFVALLGGVAVGAASSLIVGIPSLRIKGLFLAVSSLAFAVPVSTYFLNATYFPSFTPQIITRPVLFGRIDLTSNYALYELCLASLVVAYILARNFRRTRTGRVTVASRDNDRAAASYGISDKRAKLNAYAFSGALAGLGGGLYAIAMQGIGFGGFNPEKSVQVFTMVVVGGLGSLPGALAGAIYVEGAQYFLSGAAQLLATGAGVLLLLMFLPGGIGQVLFSLRDRIVGKLVRSESTGGSTAEVPLMKERFNGEYGNGLQVDGQYVKPSNIWQQSSFGWPNGRSPDSRMVSTGINAGYGSVQILFDVNIEVAKGEAVALLGTNGAGKSTFLNVVSGLLPSQSGTLSVFGEDIGRYSAIERVKRGIVMAPGGKGVFPTLTVRENLRVAGWPWRKDTATREEEMKYVLGLFPQLSNRLDTRAGNLSGGEQQMVTLAQAYLCRPRLLLIDELSLGLAPAVVAQLMEVVEGFVSRQMAVVIVEQSLNVAAEMTNRAYFLERGRVMFQGQTSQLRDRDDIARAVFLEGFTPDTSYTTDHVDSRSSFGGLYISSEPERQNGSTTQGMLRSRSALEVVSVSLSFGGIAALHDVTFDVGDGEVLGIIGANGAGKTTLLDVLSGFATPGSGSVHLYGNDITALPPWLRARAGIGRVFQDARLFQGLTVEDVLRVAYDKQLRVRDPISCIFGLGALLDSEQLAGSWVDSLVERFRLGRYRSNLVSELSTGTRRIVELACIYASSSSVILLDEPSSGVAQREVEYLSELLAEIRSELEATFIVVDHDVPMLKKMCGRLIAMHLGEVLAVGDPEEVIADDRVISAYLGTREAAISRSG